MSAQKRQPTKKEPKKEKVVEHGLTSNRRQREALDLLKHQKPVSNFLRENDISVVLGDAGCAKDFIQMHRAINGLQEGEFKQIIITKPIVELGRSIGFMPGDLEEKTTMYLQSFYDSIDKIVGNKTVAQGLKNKIRFEHVGFQRGNTFPEQSVVILSEVQNLTAHEAISYVTRLPESSKLFINGDATQSDLGTKSGLNDFLRVISGVEGVGICILDPETHQMRRRAIIEITKNYTKLLEERGVSFKLDKSAFKYIEL